MSNQPEQTPEERAVRDLLGPLADVPQRDPRQAARRRTHFLSQARSLGSPVSSSPISRLKEYLLPQERYQFRFRTLTIALLFAAIFLGSAGATAYASQGALPGEPLYGIKLFFEEAQLALTGDQTRDLELHLQFANNRVGELQTILSQPDAQEPGDLAGNFNHHVETAERLLSEVENSEDYRGQLTQILAAYNQLHPSGEDQDDHTIQEPGDEELTSDSLEETLEVEEENQDGESNEEEDEQTPDSGAVQENNEDNSSGDGSDGSGEENHEQEDNETNHSEDNEEEEETPEPDSTNNSEEEND